MYLPINLPFFKIFKDLWNHALGRPPLNSSNLSSCSFIWNSHFILFAKCSTMFDDNTWSKIIIKIQKILQKHGQQTHSFWTRKHTKRTSTSASSTVISRKRNVAKHYGEDLRFKARCSHNTKIRKKTKKLAKSKAWKGDLGNRERPGGLKTRKGGPGKN